MISLLQTARDIIEVFEEKAITYAIMGGLAVRAYGLPRPTFDIDFTATIPRDELAPLLVEFEARQYVIPDPLRKGWIDSVYGLPVFSIQSFSHDEPLNFDVFLAENDFFKSLTRRRVFLKTTDLAAWFVTCEDLLLLKLLTGRRKDLVDIQDILLVQGKLNDLYLNEWAPRLNVAEALAEAYREAGR